MARRSLPTLYFVAPGGSLHFNSSPRSNASSSVYRTYQLMSHQTFKDTGLPSKLKQRLKFSPPSHSFLSQPPVFLKPPTQTPYRLYRQIVPLSESGDVKKDHSLVFIGHVGIGNDFPVVECQSMWAAAYLDGKLELPTMVEQEIYSRHGVGANIFSSNGCGEIP